MKPEIVKEDSRITVKLCGEIDHHNAAEIREHIDRDIALKKPTQVILDFSGVSFMDSSGIGLIMGRYRIIRENGGALSVRHSGGSIGRMLSLAGLSRLGISVGGEEVEKTNQ